MSSASRYGSTTERIPGAQSLQSGVGYPLRVLGFWMAVILPFVLLGIVATGLALEFPLLVSGLVTVNVAGLVLGKDYKR